jgi:adenosine deaminase
LKRMLDLGLKATINSDDPAYFGGYLGRNWTETAQALSLSRAELVTLAKNSFTGSFLPPDTVSDHLAGIDAYLSSNS